LIAGLYSGGTGISLGAASLYYTNYWSKALLVGLRI
jgi:hypothetical protein